MIPNSTNHVFHLSMMKHSQNLGHLLYLAEGTGPAAALIANDADAGWDADTDETLQRQGPVLRRPAGTRKRPSSMMA